VAELDSSKGSDGLEDRTGKHLVLGCARVAVLALGAGLARCVGLLKLALLGNLRVDFLLQGKHGQAKVSHHAKSSATCNLIQDEDAQAQISDSSASYFVEVLVGVDVVGK
jgi:hypothetical protein